MSFGEVNIPLVFDPSKPEAHKRDLDRLASGFLAFVKNLPNLFEERYHVGNVISSSGNTSAAFGLLTRVAPLDDQTVNISLPQPKTSNAGRKLGILRLLTTGYVVLYATGTTINRRSRVVLHSSIKMTEVVFDGEEYFTTDGNGMPWGEGL